MNSNAYPQSYPASSSNSLSPSQQSVNPAFLAAFQNQQASAGSPSKFSNNVYPGSANPASINPSQLMNGINPMQMAVNGAGAINPAQLLSQQHPMNGSAMSMGMGNMGNMNMNMNMGMSNMMPSAGGMSINPAALSAAGSHPAASLPNNMNAAAMNMNHQQQSNPAFLGMGMGNMGHMNPMANAGMGSMGMGNMNMMAPNSNFPQHSNPMMAMNQPASNTNSNNTLSVLNAMGISPQQFANMNPQERHALGQRVMAMQQHAHHAREQQQQQQQQQQQHHQQQMSGRVPTFERPSSSASSHSNHAPQQQQPSPASAGPSANPPPTPTSVQPHQPQPQHYHQNSMMPPPPTPTRPLTAQSQAAQSLSRPGTSMSHHSPGGANSIPRPPSRATPGPDSGPPPSSAGPQGGSNGYLQQQQQAGKPGQGGQNPYPQGQSQGSPPPGSPYRGAKRKLGDVPGSPRIGHGGMGPPQGLPRNGSMDAMMGGPMGMSMANMVGMQGMNAQANGQMHSPSAIGGQSQQQQQQQQQMMNAIAAQRQSPRPQSAHGHHVAGMAGMAGMGPMTMNMSGMGIPGMAQQQQNHQSQSQQQQQLSSMVQHGGQQQQQQHGGQHGQQQQQPGQQSRQSSAPPTAQFSTPPQQPHQSLPMSSQSQQQHQAQVGLNGMSGMGMSGITGMGGMPMNVGGVGGMGHIGNMGMSGMGVGVGGMPGIQGMNQANISANLPQTMPPQPLLVHQVAQQQMARAMAANAANGQGQQSQDQGMGQQGMSQMISGLSNPASASSSASQQQHSPIRQSSVPLMTSNVSGAAVAGGQSHPVTPTKGVGAETIIKTEGLRSSVPPAGVPPTTAAAALANGGGSAINGVAVGATVPPVPAPTIPTLPPLPQIDTRVTKVTILPLASSQTTIPPLTSEEIDSVKEWMKVDKEYDGLVRKMKERMGEEIRETLGVGAVGWGANVGWWEKGSRSVSVGRWRARNLMAVTGRGGGEGFEIRYPRKGREPTQRRKNGRREGIKLPRRIDPAAATRPEQLVPIRLEFDVEHHKMRETFVWNLNDPVITPELFAQTLVEDYNLTNNYYGIITKSIQDQLSDYKTHHINYDAETSGGATAEEGEKRAERVVDPQLIVGRGTLDEDGSLWWEEWRKRLRKSGGKYEDGSTVKRKGKGKSGKPSSSLPNGTATAGQPVESEMEVDLTSVQKGGERPLAVNEFSLDENTMHEEMRILVKLDIISGSMKLDDQFEWDLESPNASPEEFAEIYCQDLGLGGEFKTAIAHSIREQIQTYQKSLFLVGHPLDGSVIQDDDLRSAFLPSLSSGARTLDQVQSFTPTLNYLSDGEIERSEKDRDKDMTKRRKRNMRGRRGVALPDREPIRTYRTPAIGFPELDPQVVAAAIAANAPMSSRRAAAQAALLNIENMVASENKSSFSPQMSVASLPIQPTPQPQPQVQQPQQAAMTSRDKDKTKGLFKAPSLPSSVLKPRANVTTPTPSTAADVTKLPAPLENDPPPPPVVVPPPPDSKATRVLTAKRVKELEREAKEKEFADGQHPNYINGIWHCSNCGCPESIAVGRRKGPLGDKSQCGTCGKFWHRHRRPRPVEYNSNPDYHSGLLKRETEAAKPAAKKKGGGLRGHSSLATPDVSEPQTPRSRSNGDNEVPSRPSPPPISTAVAAAAGLVDDDRPISPVSSTSSASESPLAQKLKVNGSGSHHANASSSSNDRTAVGDSTSSNQNDSASSGQDSTRAGASPSKSSQANPDPPAWLQSALAGMRAKYPNDNFEVSLRKAGTAEWRIRCRDCPGKLYTPGPGEALSNYEVHLKNRQHRQRVNDRMHKPTS